MATKRQRAFALFGAFLFFFSTIAVSAFVIYQMTQGNKSNNQQSQTAQTNQTGDKLQGKQLENFTPVATVPELKITDITVGNGAEAKENSTVTVNYTGALAKTGVIFQSSLDTGQPATFGLNQVIEGWTKGIPGMKVGGKRRLLIPAAMAYGANSPDASIPPNSDLVFDVELLNVQ